MDLTYYDPLGGESRGYGIAGLIALVRKAGPSYWNVGSGDAALYYGPLDDNRKIQIYFVPRHGFHLLYYGKGEAPVAALPSAPTPRPKWATIHVGGDPVRISTRQIVSRPQAEAILAHFATHGEPPPDTEWAPPR